MKLLIDTNVLSEAQRPQGHPAVRSLLAAADPDALFISVISVGEIAHGIALLSPGKRRRELEEWLAQTDRVFTDRVLPVDRSVAQTWGELTAKASKAGRVLHVADGLIAATAIQHGLRLVTRNTADFEPTGVLTINPWQE